MIRLTNLLKKGPEPSLGSREKSTQIFFVASYNIHRCVGIDWRRNLARTARVIKELDAGIVGLQEVDSQLPGREALCQLEYLADATGLRAIPGPTVLRHDGNYGNVLLTRYPILEVHHVDLRVPGREPRGAIDADLSVEGKKIRVILTHLGLGAQERLYQLKRLLITLTDRHCDAVIVLGDINEWLPTSHPLRWLRSHFGKSPAPRTFPSLFPMLRLDRILVRPRKALVKVRAHNTLLARMASDHLPLKATIAID